MDTVNYKCPNCSAGLAFDSKSQKMKCEYCGNTYSLEELEQLAEQQDTVKQRYENYQTKRNGRYL